MTFRPSRPTLYLSGIVFLFAFSAHAIDYGVIFGYAVHEPIPPSPCNLDGFRTNIIQVPQFRHWNRDDMGYWYSQVEEAAFANLRFIALNTDGIDRFRTDGDTQCPLGSAYDCNNPGPPTPTGNTPPCYFSRAVQAINARGYQNTLKIALFDDTGSYVDRYHKCYPTTPPNDPLPFDLGDTSNYWYFWEGKWKPYFDPTNPNYVPDANRYKVGNRPVVFLWYSAFSDWHADPGDKRALIKHLRDRVFELLGVYPFIIADQSWYGDDAAIDAYSRWFNASENPPRAWGKSAYAGKTWGAYRVGIAAPGYYANDGRLIDRDDGDEYRDALNNAATGNGFTSNVVLIEALNGSAENVGIYRGSSICRPACGSSTRPYDQCWSYPNQYLNITREEAHGDVRYITFQAEGADGYYRNSNHSPNSVYRRPSEAGANELEVFDIGANWAVRTEATEYLEFQGVTLSAASNYRFGIRYAAASDALVDVFIDNLDQAVLDSKPLPHTANDNTYTSLIFTSDLLTLNGNPHRVRVKIRSNTVRIDKWTLDAR